MTARAARWRFLAGALSASPGVNSTLDEEVYASASARTTATAPSRTCWPELGRLACDPAEAVDLYTRQSCLAVTARGPRRDGRHAGRRGLNPVTGERVVAGRLPAVLAVMATAGMYETSGDWLFDVGVPGKSGIGGGIVTVPPGKGGLGTFSPPLDRAGNSVRGQLAARLLSRTLGMGLFASEPRHATPPPPDLSAWR